MAPVAGARSAGRAVWGLAFGRPLVRSEFFDYPAFHLYLLAGLYGLYPFIPPDPGSRFQYLAFDAPGGVFSSPGELAADLPDWIAAQRSMLPYSDTAEQMEELLSDEYELLPVVRAGDFDEPGLVYDLQDGFYVPLAGFDSVRRVARAGAVSAEGSGTAPEYPPQLHRFHH